MAKLEDILPEARKGRKVRRSRVDNFEGIGYWLKWLPAEALLSDFWELEPEPEKEYRPVWKGEWRSSKEIVLGRDWIMNINESIGMKNPEEWEERVNRETNSHT